MGWKNFLLYPIYFYQKIISPVLGPNCKFYPTCSNYAVEAIQKYGIYGLLLAVKRILRCHPFSKGGYDPLI